MTSICNYSHPELQITTNLSRHGSGALFPYNPEFYDLASGLYGPGAIICWQLLLLSVILNWAFHPKDRPNGTRRPGVSVDLLGVVAYPTFAATDAVIHSLKMLGTPHRALAIFCLRYPSVDLNGFGASFNSTKIDLREGVPAEVLSLGQHAVNLTGPLDVCYMFLAASHLRALFLFLGEHAGVKPTKWASWLTVGTYGYVVVLLWVVHLSLGELVVSILLWMYETIWPFIFVCFLVACGITALVFSACVFTFARGVLGWDMALLLDGLKLLGASFLVLVFLAGPIFAIVALDRGLRFVPDVGVSVKERDQLATLIVGIATLLFTVYEIWQRRREKESSNAVELQSLTQDHG